MIGMKHIGEKFGEFRSDSVLMVVLESDKSLGDEARRYYGDLVKSLEKDTRHVEYVEDFWGDRITSAGSQSEDGKAAYVQVYLAGNQGPPRVSNRSTQCVRSSSMLMRREGSGPTSPARPPRSPIPTRPATRA